MLKFIDQHKIYKAGSNAPGVFSNIVGEEGLWYIKTGESSNGVSTDRTPSSDPNYLHYKNIGTIVEAYGSDLYNALNPFPEEHLTIRVINGSNKNGKPALQIASKLIPGYRGIEELLASGKKIEVTEDGKAKLDGKPIQGVNRHFILRYLLGDFDVANFQNIGLVEKPDHHRGQSIDFGKAFHEPELTMVHSSEKKPTPDFITVVTDPAAPSKIFLFSQLIDTDHDKLVQLFSKNTQEGRDRIQPGIIPPVADEAIFPLPEAIGSKKEVEETLRQIASVDTGKLHDVAADYENYIVNYIKENHLPLDYKKEAILDKVLDRIELIRGYVKELDQKEKPSEGPDLSSMTLTSPPALEGVERKAAGSGVRRE